uniref:Uncharacterized protein n=1 Tax=Salvator merianae TaxID=96440 RepID=A0A8D0DNN0_SALMN
MATRNLVKNFSDEAICSICLEYFKDPVTVDCGHNFCQVCITRCLEEAEGKPSCPQCRETISQRNFRPNRQLTNLLFCKEDRICICVVCDRSKEHKDHNVLPLEEAFKEYKVSLYGRFQIFSLQILACHGVPVVPARRGTWWDIFLVHIVQLLVFKDPMEQKHQGCDHRTAKEKKYLGKGFSTLLRNIPQPAFRKESQLQKHKLEAFICLYLNDSYTTSH